MSVARRRVSQVVEGVLVVCIVALLLGQVLGYPILLGFVESGSMEPTIDTQDGYIAIPEPVAGSVEQGDVIVFEAQELHGGDLTTHRVVAETDEGYITKGDGNAIRDQAGREPPVRDEQIVAKALQVNGHVITIPALGAVVGGAQAAAETIQSALATRLGTAVFLGAQGLLNLIVLACVGLYGLLALSENGRSRTRDTTRDTGVNAHTLVIGLTGLLVITATLTMLIPAGTHQVAVDGVGLSDSGTGEATIGLTNSGFVPTYAVLEPQSEGITVDQTVVHIAGRTSTEVGATVAGPPADAMVVNRVLSEHRYLAVLPQPTLYTLHRIHPWLALGVVNAVVAIPFYVLGRLILGTGRVRMQPRREFPLATRLRRLVQELY